MGPHPRPMARRTFLAGLAALVAAACVPTRRRETAASPGAITVADEASPPTTSTTLWHRRTAEPTGGLYVLTHGPAGTPAVALTIDDGTNEETVAAYVDLVSRTG